MILVIGQNSSWQNTYIMPRLDVGAVNRAESCIRSAAGKGANMARCLGSLDVDAHLLGYAGGPAGRQFTTACDAENLPATLVSIASETRMCTSLILPSGETTEIIEPAPETTEDERREFQARFRELLAKANILAIGGTAVNGERETLYTGLANAAKARDLPVFLDSYRVHGREALKTSPDILKINADELADLTNMPSSAPDDRSRACIALRETFGIRWIIITLGANGAEAYDAEGSFTAEAPRVKSVNPIGSGDAFSAGVVAALSKGDFDSETLRKALICGVAMGTANCMSLKTGAVDQDDYRAVENRVVISEGRHPTTEYR